ncbi:helix-turn-helix domain-containing protein [Planctomycetota bacterium]
MNNTKTNEVRLVRPKDAAAYLAISERKLWDLSSNNIIPIVHLGRATRYDISDLDAFITKAKESQL